MATTLQTVISTIRNADILEPAQVFYGFSQGKHPPYASVREFKAVLTYDTGGPAIRESTFAVLVIAKSVEEAESVAGEIDELLNTSSDLTPETMRCLQDSYEVGQLDEQLYQVGVEMRYTLTESLN